MTCATAPREPTSIRVIRDHYWARRAWLDHLEARIARTDAGLNWLMRVKRIGKPGT